MKNKIIVLFVLSTLILGTKAQQVLPFGGIEDSLRMYNASDSTFNDGSILIYNFFPEGDTLYVGGTFMFGGLDTLMDIGKWDGHNWHPVGFGIKNGGGVRSILKYKEQLYIGSECREAYAENPIINGAFTDIVPNSRSLARWNDSIQMLEALPSTYGGLDWSEIYGGMVVCNDTLFIPSDPPVNATWPLYSRVVGYDADIDNYVDVGALPSNVHAMAVFNGEVYAGGLWFSVKKYVGGTGYGAWQDVGGYTNYYVNAMDVDTFNNFLYVAGGFFAVDDTLLTDNVAIWNGYYWEKVGYGVNQGGDDAMSVKVYNGDVYIGRFNATGPTGGVEYNSSLLRWDGQNWHEIGPFNGGITALGIWKDTLYIGGNFDSIAGQPIYHKGIARLVDTVPNCRYLKPRIYTDNMQDTFYLSGGQVQVQFYNNNAYADSWLWSFDDGYSVTVQNPLHTYVNTGTFNVCVTVTHNSCVKTACKTIVVDYPVNVEKINKEDIQFKIYPNPTDGNFIIDINLPLTVEQAEIKVLGLKGTPKAKYQIHSGKNHIEISSATWQQGNYLVCLIVNRKLVESKKLILSK